MHAPPLLQPLTVLTPPICDYTGHLPCCVVFVFVVVVVVVASSHINNTDRQFRMIHGTELGIAWRARLAIPAVRLGWVLQGYLVHVAVTGAGFNSSLRLIDAIPQVTAVVILSID
jgi:hypothetical protein